MKQFGFIFEIAFAFFSLNVCAHPAMKAEDCAEQVALALIPTKEGSLPDFIDLELHGCLRILVHAWSSYTQHQDLAATGIKEDEFKRCVHWALRSKEDLGKYLPGGPAHSQVMRFLEQAQNYWLTSESTP